MGAPDAERISTSYVERANLTIRMQNRRFTRLTNALSKKVENLEHAIALDPLTGDYGIGHTRWATHGRPTEENAHPHRDCTGRIVVVHNGIIENYLDLKQELQRQGHRFVTETDTEIVAHLVEREMKDDGLENAVRRALLLMRGLFALVLISADDPEKIVAARNGPPAALPGSRNHQRFPAQSSGNRGRAKTSESRSSRLNWRSR